MRNILAIIGLITVFEFAEPPVKHAYYWVVKNGSSLVNYKQTPIANIKK